MFCSFWCKSKFLSELFASQNLIVKARVKVKAEVGRILMRTRKAKVNQRHPPKLVLKYFFIIWIYTYTSCTFFKIIFIIFFISHTQTITIHYIYNSLQVTLSFLYLLVYVVIQFHPWLNFSPIVSNSLSYITIPKNKGR